jgi:hypothetical protein
MSDGTRFLQYVETLREIGFPVDKVTGGDIYSVYKAGFDVRDGILRLHTVAETRRKMKESMKKTTV